MIRDEIGKVSRNQSDLKIRFISLSSLRMLLNAVRLGHLAGRTVRFKI